jgi:adenine-specific DNA-methyltransferase
MSLLSTVPTVPTVPNHKKYAQYFTTNPILKEKVFSFLLNLSLSDTSLSNVPHILEPSVGRGDLVTYIQERIPTATFDMYEIDTTIDFLAGIDREKIHFGDFLSIPFSSDQKYKTIVANPPFLSTPNSKKNQYICFIEKCFDLLAESGEMVFIIPSDFFHLTSALPILKRMMEAGTFTHIYHPGNERMFEGACVDVLIFRYCRSIDIGDKIVLYNDEPRKIVFDSCFRFLSYQGSLIPGPSALIPLVSDSFDTLVGMVSAKDEVFKHTDLGNISVITGENRQETFIFIESFPSPDPRIDAYLGSNKTILMERKIRKFHDQNWFEWGAPRNITTIRRFWGQPCIYVATLTRDTRVAFLGKVAYFGGGLLMMIPKNADKKTTSSRFLESVVVHFNSPEFQQQYRFGGRFKMGQRMLCNASIPEI